MLGLSSFGAGAHVHYWKGVLVKQMTVEEFRAHCLAVLNEVARTGAHVVITKRGKPIAKLVPVAKSKRRKFLGSLEGILLPPKGDLTEATVPLEDWGSLK
jgi:prevent-host-death family protein